MADDSVEVRRVMLRSEGDDLIVEMEIGGHWIEVIRASDGRRASTPSQIVEPAGLLRAVQVEAQPFPAWKWACGQRRQAGSKN